MKLKTNRIKTLVDGIFAIIMTVMVISFLEVLSFTNPVNNSDFHKLFLSLGDDFIVYVMSFLILGIFWLEHHWQFNFLKYINRRLVFINIIWLMFICLIPFSTMLLGNHYNFLAPVLVFEFNILIVALILGIHWCYVSHNSQLTEESLDKKTIRKHRDISLLITIFIILMIVLTFFSNYFKR